MDKPRERVCIICQVMLPAKDQQGKKKAGGGDLEEEGFVSLRGRPF